MRALLFSLVLMSVGCAARSPLSGIWRPMTPARFNQLAQRLDTPLAWRDDDGDGAPAPDEMHALLFYGRPGDGVPPPVWSEHGAYTPALVDAVERVMIEDVAPAPTDPRLAALTRELDTIVPDLVATDASRWSPSERAFARDMIAIADHVEALFHRQRGIAALEPSIPPEDTVSRRFVHATSRSFCAHDRGGVCTAVVGNPPPRIDPWPPEIQDGSGRFCAQMLEADAAVVDPFTVVRIADGALVTTPYRVAYADLLAPLATALGETADTVSDADVARYFRTAASDVSTDGLDARDLLAGLRSSDSEWFVDVGAIVRSTWDWCDRKAAYHMLFGRRDHATDALAVSLEEHAPELGAALARVAWATYRPTDERVVPDFVRVIFGAGADRFTRPQGMAYPGRPVVFTRDASPASDAATTAQRTALLTEQSVLRPSPLQSRASRIGTMLHETTHALARGLEGRTERGSIREGLADAAVPFLARWLRERGLIDDALQDAILREWMNRAAFDAAYCGLTDPHAQGAAMRFGMWTELGAVHWDETAHAADGREGAFVIDYPRALAVVEEILARLVDAYVSDDEEMIADLHARYVDRSGPPCEVTSERAARTTSGAREVYAIDW